MVFIILELGSIIAYLGVETAVLNREERIGILSTWPTAVGWCFFSLSFLLFLSVYFLINRLNKKRDQVASTQADKDFFNRKIRTLIAILVMFSSTYLMRGVWDLISNPASSVFVQDIVTFAIFILCDFVPVMFMLVFHFKNFYKKSAKVAENEMDRE